MRALLAVLICASATASAMAQAVDEQFRGLLALHPTIKFVADPKEEGSFFFSPNTVFKPKGDGPFPAVVVVHSCEGVQGWHLQQHVKALLAAGMVVLLQDSFGPRGRSNCGQGNTQALSIIVGAADAYAALAHLHTYPFVQKDRIYMTGYSWGGNIASLLASPVMAQSLGQTVRFNATVGNYSPCKTPRGTLVNALTDRPLLLLMGEKDTETPSSTCFPLLDEYKAQGLPVHWHVYPGATHGWDKEGQARNGYIYNAAVTTDATRRMIEFFNGKN